MKIAFLGYGKMGKAIEVLALEAGHEVVLRIDVDNQADLTAASLRRADVAIEFSHPASALANISRCLEAGVPVVAGTTGWLDQLEEARALCRERGGAMLYASNFSIGVNLFFALNRYLAGLMDGHLQYGVRLEEIHHVQKIDAPSGTAITLAEDVVRLLHHKKSWTKEENPATTEVSIRSHRTGQVPGTHEVIYESAVDTITIRHEALSREGFARGALRAAEWIIGRTGYFEMKDMLGF